VSIAPKNRSGKNPPVSIVPKSWVGKNSPVSIAPRSRVGKKLPILIAPRSQVRKKLPMSMGEFSTVSINGCLTGSISTPGEFLAAHHQRLMEMVCNLG
jgi:hypothetical protein